LEDDNPGPSALKKVGRGSIHDHLHLTGGHERVPSATKKWGK